MAGVKLPRDIIDPLARAVCSSLVPSFERLQLCGSFRRGDHKVGDIDVVVSGPRMDMSSIPDRLGGLFDRVVTVSDGKEGPRHNYRLYTSSLKFPINLDIWLVPGMCFGAATLYCTGPGMLNTVMRRYARTKGLRLDLMGVSDGRRVLASRTEEDCFRALGWEYVAPEVRSDWRSVVEPYLGEIDNATTAV